MAVSKPRSPGEGRPVEHPRKDRTPSGSPVLSSAPHAVGAQRQLTSAAAIAFGLWAAALIGLVLLTANPITLNYAQITRAPLIVEGTFDHKDATESNATQLHVRRSWPDGRAGETFVIDAANQLPLAPGRSYLVPLQPTNDGQYRIVPTPVPLAAPAVYPANPDTVAQLEAILGGE